MLTVSTENAVLDEGWRLARRRLIPRTLARPDFLSGALQPTAALNPEFGTP